METPELVLKLDLSHSNLTEIPEYFFQLTNLIELNLSHNKLKTVPESITKLSKKSITLPINFS